MAVNGLDTNELKQEGNKRDISDLKSFRSRYQMSDAPKKKKKKSRGQELV